MEQWRRCLSVTMDVTPDNEEPRAADVGAADAQQDQGSGPHLYLTDSDRRQAGT
jgi:hypothetical protein